MPIVPSPAEQRAVRNVKQRKMQAGTEKRRIAVNAGSNGASFVVAILLAFLVQPVLVHGLGDERFGVWLLVNSIVAYMALGDLGIGAAVLRYVAKFDGLGDTESINRIFSTSISIFGIIGLLLLAVTFVLSFGWSCPLGVEARLAGETRWLLTLLGINFAFGLPFGLYRTALEGLGRYPVINAIRIVSLLVVNGFVVGIVWAGGGLTQIGAAITACSLIQNAAYAIAARRYIPSLGFRPRYVDLTTFRTIWSYSAFMFLALTAWHVADQCNPIIINWSLGPSAITYFGVAAVLVAQAGQALVTMMHVVTPTVSKWEALNDFVAIRRLLLIGTRYVLYVAMPIQLGLILLGFPFLSLWMGDRYGQLSYPTLVLLAIPLPLVSLYSFAGRILQGTGKIRMFSAVAMVRSVVTIVLAILVVGRWGIEGVAAATSISITLQYLAVTVLVCRVTATSPTTLFAGAYAKPLVLSIVLAPVWIFGVRCLPSLSWVNLIIVGIAGIVVYVAAVLAADRQLRADVTALLRTSYGIACRLLQPSRLNQSTADRDCF